MQSGSTLSSSTGPESSSETRLPNGSALPLDPGGASPASRDCKCRGCRANVSIRFLSTFCLARSTSSGVSCPQMIPSPSFGSVHPVPLAS